MKLYTSVDIAPSARQIGYGDKILLLGSCFADNIGAKFSEHYFQATVNPFGTLYNPASIAAAITNVGNSQLVEHNGLWHSMMHHGAFSGKDKEEVFTRCEQSRALPWASSTQMALWRVAMTLPIFSPVDFGVCQLAMLGVRPCRK